MGAAVCKGGQGRGQEAARAGAGPARYRQQSCANYASTVHDTLQANALTRPQHIVTSNRAEALRSAGAGVRGERRGRARFITRSRSSANILSCAARRSASAAGSDARRLSRPPAPWPPSSRPALPPRPPMPATPRTPAGPPRPCCAPVHDSQVAGRRRRTCTASTQHNT